jgi:S-adenosylmethionine:diacylglycerol 3-amino-3-carboxypropyl transferase
MPQTLNHSTTLWEANSFRGRTPRLLFGAMYEDPAIELEAFPPRSRVFCIASAGCTARALSAAGHDVTAVDINPRQLQYAQARAGGAPLREGVAERMLRRGRALLPLFGWSERRRREFLLLRNPTEQVYFWRQTLDSLRWRWAVDALLSRFALGLIYATPFLASLPRTFGAQIRARLQRGWANHSNASNPYAWRLLLGESPGTTESSVRGVRFACADAATHLESAAAASFDAFSLSNVTDGASPAYVQRLHRALKHAAAPGALVVTRSFAEPASAENNCAARDRSLLWGSVQVKRTGDLDLCSTY